MVHFPRSPHLSSECTPCMTVYCLFCQISPGRTWQKMGRAGEYLCDDLDTSFE